MEHPQISTNEKKAIFDRIFRGKIDDEILAFLKLLIDKGRILYLREKLNQMEKIHLEKNNTLLALIKTSVPMLEDEKERLQAKLESMYNKKIIMKCEIDKKILGGVYVRVGDDVIDGTVRSRLDEMKDIMLVKE